MPTQKNHLIVESLYKQYGLCYSPLLLPKIAKYGFNVSSGSLFANFITKIKLYDLKAIDKENSFIAIVKVKLNHMAKNISPQHKNISPQSKYEKEKIINFNIKGQKSVIRNLSTKLHEIPRNLITRNSHLQNDKPAQKHKWQDMMTTYQQLYQFVKILTRRQKDLNQLITILSKQTLNIKNLQTFIQIIQSHIQKARQIIDQIFPHEAKQSFQQEDDKRMSAFFKLRKQKMTFCTTDKATQESDNNDSSLFNDDQNDKRLKTQQSGQQSGKFKFLKRNPSKNLQTEFINSKIKKRSRFQSSLLKINRTIRSDKPQKSFKMNDTKDKDETESKNTQQMFDQQLQKEHEQKLFGEKQKQPKMMHSQKEIVESLVKEEKKMLRTLKSLITEGFMFGEGGNNYKKMLDADIVLMQSENNLIEQQPKNLVTQPPPRHHNSEIIKPMKRQSQRNSKQLTLNAKQRKSLLSQSRSSINTQNSRQYKKSQFNINGGKNKRNTRDMSQQSQQVIQSRNFFKQKGNKKRLRVGGIKQHDENKFHNQSSRTLLSNRQSLQSRQMTQKTNKNRRTGKQLPQQMKAHFQRLLQQQNIAKMIQANNQKDLDRQFNNDHRNSKTKLKTHGDKSSKQLGKLKRIKTGTQTSIVFNLPSSRDLGEFNNHFNNKQFRVSKQKKAQTEKENFTANYSDLLTLQKNLKPIATYNESKMVTRYSQLGGENDTKDYQFKFQNGKFLFNHEFYLRKDEQNRSEVAQQLLERRKSLRKETMKFEFMHRLKKRLQQKNQPVQCGYDDCQDQSQKFILDQREKIRLGMII